MDTLATALGPAFAAGFAVQRLLEILDPLVNKLIGEENKKIALGLVSLVVGTVIAFLANIAVLSSLNINVNRYLDNFVAGLIISAGTEGFNSIMKFLSYKKEETKAGAITEKTQAVNALTTSGVRGRMLAASFENAALAPINNFAGIMEQGMSVEQGLEKSLMIEIKKRWRTKFVEDGWKDKPFSEYTADVDDAKVTVFHATRNIATELDIQLRDDVVRDLQNHTSLSTKPTDALPLMNDALNFPATPV